MTDAVRAEAALDWVESARDRCGPGALEGLWAAVPEPMRLSCFSESTVPPQYAGAFCYDGTWWAGVDLSGLPERMRRELAWCVFRIIKLGGKVPTPGLSMLVHRLGEVITDRDLGQAPPLYYRDLVANLQPKMTPPTPSGRRGHPPSMERPRAPRPWRTTDLG